jgi:hypothetical protein
MSSESGWLSVDAITPALIRVAHLEKYFMQVTSVADEAFVPRKE